MEISLNALIDRQNRQLADLLDRQIEGQTIQGLDGLISQAEAHLDRLNDRLEQRLLELERERHCTIADIIHLGRAWVLPHPERATPRLAPMVEDADIERIAVDFVIRHEESRGWQVESVESREPRLRPDLSPAPPRGPADGHRGPVHRGQGPGRRWGRSH